MNAKSIENRLEKAVRKVFDDNEFVAGMRSICFDDRDREALIRFIEKGKDVTTETVAVYAIKLKNDRLAKQ